MSDILELIQKVLNIAHEVARLRRIRCDEGIDLLEPEGDCLCFRANYRCCGSYESEWFSFPARYLDDDTWPEKEHAQIAEAVRLAAERKVREAKEAVKRKATAEADAVERRRRQYEKLKQEFEHSPPSN